MSVKESLLEALIATREYPILHSGICANAMQRIQAKQGYRSAAVRELQLLFRAWPEFSGDIDYPVPSPFANRSPEQAYDHAGLRPWGNGVYGKARRRLLEFCIATLESELA